MRAQGFAQGAEFVPGGRHALGLRRFEKIERRDCKDPGDGDAALAQITARKFDDGAALRRRFVIGNGMCE